MLVICTEGARQCCEEKEKQTEKATESSRTKEANAKESKNKEIEAEEWQRGVRMLQMNDRPAPNHLHSMYTRTRRRVAAREHEYYMQ